MIKRKKLFKAIILFFAISSFSFFYSFKHFTLLSLYEIEQTKYLLDTCSEEERIAMNKLLEYVNNWCQFPYTLVEGKPMSVANIVTSYAELPKRVKKTFYSRKQLHKEYLLGFHSLQKLLKTKKSAFALMLVNNIPCDGTSYVAIAHKPSLLTIFKKHEPLFQETVGSSLSAEALLNEFLSEGSFVQYRLFKNQKTLGILLGFGERNAELYAQKQREILQPFNDDLLFYVSKWRLPGFLCDPNSEETKQLKKHYKEIQKKIAWNYSVYDEKLTSLSLLLKPSSSP